MSTKVKAAGINADRLKSFVERIEKLEEERQALGGDLRDVYSEAKGVGYDVKTMRKIVSLRKKDASDRDEEDTLLDVYKHALGMDTGAQVVTILPSEDDLIERAGRIVGEVDRCMSILRGTKPPKIAAIQELIGCSTGKAGKLRALVDKRLAAEFSRTNAIVRENENPPDGVITVTTGDIGIPISDQEATGLGSKPHPHPRGPSDLVIGSGESRDSACRAPEDEKPITGDQLTPSESPSNSSGPALQDDQPTLRESVGALAEPKAERVATPIEDIPLFLRRTREQVNA